MLTVENRATAADNTLRKHGEVWTSHFLDMLVDRHAPSQYSASLLAYAGVGVIKYVITILIIRVV